MKKSFSGFYSPSNVRIRNAWKHEKTLFVFDTNILLNLYSYTEEARKDFFKILDGISDRVWLPNHVGLEYQRNRLNVIKNEKYIFQKFKRYLENIEKNINSQEFKDLKLDARLPDLNQKTEELHTSIQNIINDFKNVLETQNAKQPDVRSGDKIRKKLEVYFDSKIGKPFNNQTDLDTLYKDGKVRYDNNIPPGYKDVKTKKDDKEFTYGGLNYMPMYGDLIIWKQIIEESKNPDIKSVLFITDDTKEDWWYIIDSSGEKRIGVRAELREEIERESNISLFDVMTTSSFMEDGKKYLELDVSDDSIDEVEEKTRTIRVKLSDLQRQSLKYGDLYKDDLLKNLKGYGYPNSLFDEIKKQSESINNSFQSVVHSQEVQDTLKIVQHEEEKRQQERQKILDIYKNMNM